MHAIRISDGRCLMHLNQRPGSAIRQQRGLSIVELMVGIAIGLVVVAAAALLLSGQLGENRRLLVETQLQQDLRAATDIITREMRRAGGSNELESLQTLWFPGLPLSVESNFYGELYLPAVGTSSLVEFTYNPGNAGAGRFGFKLDAGVIKTLLLAGGWQDLTDARAMEVTRFDVTRLADTTIKLPCPNLCPSSASPTGCWPTLNERNFTVAITARARNLAGVERSILSRVRLRNDFVRFSVAPVSGVSSGSVCPV